MLDLEKLSGDNMIRGKNVQSILNKARTTQRQAIEGMYEDTATILVKRAVKDEKTGVTKNKDVVLVKDEPCRLSYRTMPSTSDAMKNSTTADYVNQVITLFVRPELQIPSGSKIEVTKFGNVDSIGNEHKYTQVFRNSAVPKIHGSHQEIILMLADKYDAMSDYHD